jgi:hypothetical protein
VHVKIIDDYSDNNIETNKSYTGLSTGNSSRVTHEISRLELLSLFGMYLVFEGQNILPFLLF